MSRLLLMAGAAALAAGAMTAADAAEWEIDVGGRFPSPAGHAAPDLAGALGGAAAGEAGQRLRFQPTITLENGLQIGAAVRPDAASTEGATGGATQGAGSEGWAAGLNLGYGGVTVGGAFGEQSAGALGDGGAWEAGVGYTRGPWGFSFTYFSGDESDGAAGGTLSGVVSDQALDQYLLGVNYDLATGVALNSFGGYVDFDEAGEGLGRSGDAAGDDVDGWIVGTGIKIRF